MCDCFDIFVYMSITGGDFAGKFSAYVSKVLIARFSDTHLLVNFLAVYVQFANEVKLDLPVHSLF